MHPTIEFRDLDRRTPINLRLPNLDYRRQLEEAARARGTTISGYVRSLVLEALRREQEQSEYEQSAAFFG